MGTAFNTTTKEEPAAVRVAVLGELNGDWLQALGPKAPAWRELPNVSEVMNLRSVPDAMLSSGTDADVETVVIPFLEDDIAACPASVRALIPSVWALATCRHKGLFADFMASIGLARLSPRDYAWGGAVVRYPAVLKRLDLSAGRGVRVVTSAEQLADLLDQEPWRGQVCVLQEYVTSGSDLVTHGVCDRGAWLWSTTFEYQYVALHVASMPGSDVPCREVALDPRVRRDFEIITSALQFSGPFNIDFRFDGTRPIVFELNPRFGFSLMRPAHTTHLADALSAIIAGVADR